MAAPQPQPGPAPVAPAVSEADRWCRDWLASLPARLNREAAGGARIVYGFDLATDSGGSLRRTVTVEGGQCRVSEGIAGDASAVFRVSTADWRLLCLRQMSGAWAFVSGRLKVEGDRSAARKLEHLFLPLRPADGAAE